MRPVFLKSNRRAAALVQICSIALLIYGLIETQVHTAIAPARTLPGLLPEGRTARPTAENIFKAFNGLGYQRARTPQGIQHIPDPLNTAQTAILYALGVPPSLVSHRWSLTKLQCGIRQVPGRRPLGGPVPHPLVGEAPASNFDQRLFVGHLVHRRSQHGDNGLMQPLVVQQTVRTAFYCRAIERLDLPDASLLGGLAHDVSPSRISPAHSRPRRAAAHPAGTTPPADPCGGWPPHPQSTLPLAS